MPDLSALSKIEDEHRCFPFWSCLSDSSRYALETAYRRATGYKKRLQIPGTAPEMIDFDPAAEMVKVPHYTAEARR